MLTRRGQVATQGQFLFGDEFNRINELSRDATRHQIRLSRSKNWLTINRLNKNWTGGRLEQKLALNPYHVHGQFLFGETWVLRLEERVRIGANRIGEGNSFRGWVGETPRVCFRCEASGKREVEPHRRARVRSRARSWGGGVGRAQHAIVSRRWRTACSGRRA